MKRTNTELLAKLTELATAGTLPIANYPAGAALFRVQNERYLEGFHFSRPTGNKMGRYNDPLHQLGVCYVATDSTTAMAEFYLRQASNFIYYTDLDRNQLCQLKLTRDIRVLDLGRLLPKIGVQLDAVSGADYGLTQAITGFFASNPQYKIDGIAYRSRHYDGGDHCLALFEGVGLRTHAMQSISAFSTTDIPPNWRYPTIDGEEILTEQLGINIVG